MALGVLADAVLADPARAHPVAGFGGAAGALERRMWADSRGRGALFTALGFGSVTACAIAATALFPRPPGRLLLTATCTWAVLGGTSLAREAGRISRTLTDGDLTAARRRLPALCGRDPSALDADGLVRAAMESVAENTSDAAVAPLFWGAAAGVPGLVGYRAVNTLDAMVGHRSERYGRFGTAAARLDDIANWLPARMCCALTAAGAPLVGGSPAAVLRGWRRDGRAHASPNAGPVEAAFAAALGVRLGGPVRYSWGVA
ncbi:MAG: adenosylcobinamide-phosphate synthase CbiB, partial [Actinomycetota bacterium]|nr:adenosylcobinamide-phosphate synthase CbiB [Actinomycetota bacterium]